MQIKLKWETVLVGVFLFVFDVLTLVFFNLI